MDNLLLKSFVPEIFLSITLLLQLLYNVKKVTALKYNFPLIDKEIFFQIYFILFLTLTLLFNIKIEGIFSNFLFLNDLASSYIKIIFIFSVLFILIFIWQSFVYQNLNFFEFFTIFFFSILASLLLVSCYDFLSTYLVLELQSLCFYILAGIKRNSTFSVEAALKYFITGSFFSCIFLFGALLMYGELGTTNFYFINLLTSLPFAEDGIEKKNILIISSTILILITFFFKLAIVPFHFWVPDVYDGAPLSSTIILAVLPKIILFTLLIRFLLVNINLLKNLEFLLYTSGLLSIIWGTYCALKQKRMKKLFIYSSIAQLGFVLIALTSFSKDSIMSVFFFIIIYNLTASLGWGALTSVYGFQKQISFFKKKKIFPAYLSNFINLVKTNSAWSFVFLVFFFSLAGMPPFLGFLGKFYLFLSIIKSQYFTLIMLLMLLASLSAFYYIRVLKLIFFEVQKNKKINQLFQGNFVYLHKDIGMTLICFFSMGLLYLFFLPTHLILISKYISIGFFKL
jgi:NADH-quinone oxidoreductase subunit N